MQDFHTRVSDETLVGIFDDERICTVGQPLSPQAEARIEEFALDSESEIEQLIAKTYGECGLDTVRAMGLNCPRAIKRLVLDVFEIRIFRRHPQYIRAHWIDREASVQRDMEALRLRERQLDVVGDPEPAFNEGVETVTLNGSFSTLGSGGGSASAAGATSGGAGGGHGGCGCGCACSGSCGGARWDNLSCFF